MSPNFLHIISPLPRFTGVVFCSVRDEKSWRRRRRKRSGRKKTEDDD